MAVPSPAWFPSSLSERATWFQNFASQFAIVGPTLGFLPADVTAVNADNDAVQWLATVAVQVTNYEKAMTQYRKLMLEGEIGKPGVDLPAPPVYPAGAPTVDAGIFARLVSLVERIRVVPTYTTEDGALLGINPIPTPGVVPNELQPNPKLAALPGNVVEFTFTRGKTEGIDIEIEIDNAGSWENAGRFFKSPGQIVIPQNTLATARSVKMRARYLLDNSPVGQYSEIDVISTIP